MYWNAPDDPDGAPISNYRVERKVKADAASQYGEWEWVQTCLATSGTLLYTHCTDPDEPDADESRMYRVAAQNAAGIGAFTGAITTPRPAADHMHPPTTAALTAPTGVTSTSDDAGELSMTWEGAENADLYVLLAVNLDADPISWERTTIIDGAARSGTVPGLTIGERYLGIVVAVRGTGADLQVLYDTAEIVPVQ